ncbi:stimulator of interferon genes protein isoform X1 [Pleurodeles waltl]|uniref:stimulator of interferon genes protein isoform X1 n=2 Tax=Pleurodeles waltl TaxID=8319 RepID=UPI003709B2C3
MTHRFGPQMIRDSECFNFQTNKIIPKERGKRACIVACVLSIILVAILLGNNYSFVEILRHATNVFLITALNALVKGLCDFFEEINHLKTRYHGKWTEAAKACINFKHSVIPFIICGLVFLALSYERFQTKLIRDILIASICNLLHIATGFQTPTKMYISKICEKNKLNVAHGLAWSYYIGYLKIILPEFKESLRLFKKENENLLRRKETCKLHILIPVSCEMYDSLSNADSNIEFFKSLPPIYKDRAGVKERIYKNTIYKIFDEEKRPYYCIVEYATPLASLREMSNLSSAAFSSEDRVQQAKLFYRTLESILQTCLEPEHRNMCKLIVYDDCQENITEEGNSHFLSNLILKHLKQQQEEEYSLFERNEEN